MSPVIVRRTPNYFGEHVGAGLSQLLGGLGEARRAADLRREAETEIQAQQQADQARIAGFQMPQREGLVGPPGPQQLDPETQRAQEILGTIKDPRAREMFIQDFRQEKQRRLLDEAFTRTRRQVMSSVQTGAIGEDQAAGILEGLKPDLYAQDPQAAMKAIGEVEPAIRAARENMARQQADQVLWETAVQGMEEKFARAQDIASPDQLAEAEFSKQMLLQEWADLTPTERRIRIQDIEGKLEQPRESADPRERLRSKLIEGFVLKGVPEQTEDMWGDPVTTYRQVSLDEAERLADERMGLLEQQMTQSPGQIYPMGGDIPNPTPAPVESNGQVPRGTLRSRDQFLGADKGVAEDPGQMRQNIATAISLGVPMEMIAQQLGLDLDTLTEEDVREITYMVDRAAGGGEPR